MLPFPSDGLGCGAAVQSTLLLNVTCNVQILLFLTCFFSAQSPQNFFPLLVKATEWCFFSPLITVDFPRSFYKEIIRATGRIIIIRECSWHSGRTFKNVKTVPDLCRSVEQTHISLSGCQRGVNPSVSGNNGSDETLILGAASKAPFWSFFATFQCEVSLSGTLWFLICFVFTFALRGGRGQCSHWSTCSSQTSNRCCSHYLLDGNHITCFFAFGGNGGGRGVNF